MNQERYDRLLNLAERSDLTVEERQEVIEMVEALSDVPPGRHAALPRLLQAIALVHGDSEAAAHIRQAIGLLRRLH